MRAPQFPPPLWGRDRERGGDEAPRAGIVVHRVESDGSLHFVRLQIRNRCSVCSTPLPVPPSQGGGNAVGRLCPLLYADAALTACYISNTSRSLLLPAQQIIT